jgi:hypothetical protein
VISSSKSDLTIIGTNIVNHIVPGSFYKGGRTVRSPPVCVTATRRFL